MKTRVAADSKNRIIGLPKQRDTPSLQRISPTNCAVAESFPQISFAHSQGEPRYDIGKY
jgi:hypothetical protein